MKTLNVTENIVKSLRLAKLNKITSLQNYKINLKQQQFDEKHKNEQ